MAGATAAKSTQPQGTETTQERRPQRQAFPHVVSCPVTVEVYQALVEAKEKSRQSTLAGFIRTILEDYVDSCG